MATPNKNFFGPKRHIERVGNNIDDNITNSTTNIILHTCEDRETLVRTIIQLDVGYQNPGDYALVIAREPQGTAVIAPGVGQSLDIPMVKEEIWTYMGRAPQTADQSVQHITVDLKSMRKLDVGDEITLRHLGSVQDCALLVGRVTLFFKE